MRVHHKAAIKSLTSHSEKIIATFSHSFPLKNCRFCEIFAKFSQNYRKIIAKFSQNFRTHFTIRNCRFYVKLSQNYRKIIAKFSQNYRKIIALISPLETADFCEITAKLSPKCLIKAARSQLKNEERKFSYTHHNKKKRTA